LSRGFVSWVYSKLLLSRLVRKTMKRLKSLELNKSVLLICAGLLFTTAVTQLSPDIPIGSFSSASVDAVVPEGWEEIKFSKTKPTDYRLMEDEGRVVVQAQSEGTASGLIKEVDINPELYSTLSWNWKIDQVLEKGDVNKKKGDDFAARIYITFDYDAKNLPFGERIKYRALRLLGYRDIPLRAINYVWSNKVPVGTMVPSAYTNWVTMIAVQSGNENTNTWQFENRNVYEDYIAAFGEEPGNITGIAIMTDTDNTKESAMAYFGDITVHQEF